VRRTALALSCLAAAGLTIADITAGQTPVTPGAATQPPLPAPAALPMPEYLAVLQQIAPAARDGAEAYLQAFARRCRRELTVAELRRRVADDGGDPLLMQMMRAAHVRDRALLDRLAASVRCEARG
jgi:hypothetical protein